MFEGQTGLPRGESENNKQSPLQESVNKLSPRIQEDVGAGTHLHPLSLSLSLSLPPSPSQVGGAGTKTSARERTAATLSSLHFTPGFRELVKLPAPKGAPLCLVGELKGYAHEAREKIWPPSLSLSLPPSLALPPPKLRNSEHGGWQDAL